MDPVKLLREVFTGKRKVKLDEKYLVFDKNLKIKADTPLAWYPPENTK